MSHENNLESMIFLYQIVFELQGIITGPRNIGHIDLHIF